MLPEYLIAFTGDIKVMGEIKMSVLSLRFKLTEPRIWNSLSDKPKYSKVRNSFSERSNNKTVKIVIASKFGSW